MKVWRLFRLAGREADGKMADLRAPGISPGALNSYSPRNPVVTLGPGAGNTFRDELREHRPERRNPVSCSIRANMEQRRTPAPGRYCPDQLPAMPRAMCRTATASSVISYRTRYRPARSRRRSGDP